MTSLGPLQGGNHCVIVGVLGAILIEGWGSSEARMEKDPLPCSRGCWQHSVPHRRLH